MEKERAISAARLHAKQDHHRGIIFIFHLIVDRSLRDAMARTSIVTLIG